MFGCRLDSNYSSANKVFWQTIRKLRGKSSSTTNSVMNSSGNILSDENEIFSPVRATSTDTCDTIDFGKEEVFTLTEVAPTIRGLKSGKAAVEDEIQPEMLKALNGGVPWLTKVCQVTWKLGKAPNNWQTGVIISIHKKGESKKCTNYREISLLSFPGKMYAKYLEGKCREIMESKLVDSQCGFRPGSSITDQIFTLRQIFENSWEDAKDAFACFVDLQKA